MPAIRKPVKVTPRNKPQTTKLKADAVNIIPDRGEFGWLEPGDVVLTYAKKSIFSKGIVFFERLARKDGSKPRYSHAMIHIGDGFMVSSELKVRVVPFEYMLENIKRYTVFRRKGIPPTKRYQIAMDAITYYGLDYDILHIVGFALWSVTGLEWFRRKLQVRYREVCSTLTAKVYAKNGIYFLNEKDKDLTPDDLDMACRNAPAKWELVQEKEL